MASLLSKQEPIVDMPDDPIGWMNKFFRIPRIEVADMRLHLQPYQEEALRIALSRDAEGKYNYSIVLWGDIKKSIKSCIAAAVHLFKAWHTEHGSYYIIANDLKQANSRVAFYIRRAIELHPELSKKCKVKPSGYTIEFPNKAIIEAIPVDPSGEAGSNADGTEWTELWGATTDAADMMWTEMAVPPNKFGYAQRWIDSYAGFEEESNLLYRQYETGVLKGTRIHPDYPFYENRSAKMFSLWNEEPRCPWQTPLYYATEETLYTPSEFNRIHRNKWAHATATFCPPEWWTACQGIVPQYKKEICVGAIDGGISNDSFGLIVMSKDGDKTVVRYAKCWYPPRNGDIDFEGTPEAPGPQMEIERLSKEYNIAEWAFDPMHVKDMVNRMQKKGVAYFYEFSQGNMRLEADKAWYDKIMRREVLHSGEYDLEEHIKNSNAQTISVEGKQFLRIVKRSQDKKVDLNVCASMASHELHIGLFIQ